MLGGWSSGGLRDRVAGGEVTTTVTKFYNQKN